MTLFGKRVEPILAGMIMARDIRNIFIEPKWNIYVFFKSKNLYLENCMLNFVFSAS